MIYCTVQRKFQIAHNMQSPFYCKYHSFSENKVDIERTIFPQQCKITTPGFSLNVSFPWYQRFVYNFICNCLSTMRTLFFCNILRRLAISAMQDKTMNISDKAQLF